MCTRKPTLKMVLLLALPVTLIIGAQEDSGCGRVIPPTSPGVQKLYTELSADWWQWALEIPASRNPLLDTTGEFSAEGQSGPVWFLAGTTGGGPVTRECTVPFGKKIFFPILDVFFFNCPNENFTVEEMRGILGQIMDAANILELTIDGETFGFEELLGHRTRSPVFGFTVPEEWIFSGGCDPTHIPGAWVDPCVSDGYWALISPLAPGEHTIHFHGGYDHPMFGSFETEVTYNLTVERRRP